MDERPAHVAGFLWEKEALRAKAWTVGLGCAFGAAPRLIVGSLPTHNGTISRIFVLVEKRVLLLFLRVLSSKYEMNFHLYPLKNRRAL